MAVNKSINMKKFGKLAGLGITTRLKDMSNTKFTDYVSQNRDKLVKFARTINGMDEQKADDLINDLWISYKKNEDNNKCYDTTGGHDAYITVEEAVKSRIKLMSKNRTNPRSSIQESKYLHSTSKDAVVLGHFMHDNEDDSLQKLVTLKAKESSNEIESLDFDLKESMMHFVSCTQDCRVPGIVILERMDYIVGVAERNEINLSSADYIKDLWTKATDMKDTFRSLLSCYCRDRNLFFESLNLIKEEQEQCKQLLTAFGLGSTMGQACAQPAFGSSHQ